MSDNKELCKALFAYQSKGITVSKNATNPFHKNKYATLEHIYSTVVPELNACGLMLTQPPSFDAVNGAVFVTTRLTHVATGQYIEAQAGCHVEGKAQDVGSAITYLRRYGFALIGLVTDDDDDGNAATKLKDKPAEKKAKDKEEPSGKTASENKEDGMKKGILDFCMKVAGGDKEQAKGVLFEITDFDDKDKKHHDGLREGAQLMKAKGWIVSAYYGRMKDYEKGSRTTSGRSGDPLRPGNRTCLWARRNC
jgi:hypothetical protein